MVQGWAGQDCSKQDFHPQHRPGWPPNNTNRMYDVPGGRRPPMEIHDALEACCGIQVKQAFVAVIGHDNKVSTFMSPSHDNHHFVTPSFFNLGAFQEVANGPSQQSRQAGALFPTYPILAERQYQSRHDDRVRADRRRLPEGGDGEEEAWSMQGRKRPRARLDSYYEEEEESAAASKVATRVPVTIGDTEAVRDYYESLFNEIQQGACKTLAKAWVKLIEPKKQTAHPYTKKEEGKPDWWPKPWGEASADMVRHKEPDHLYKRERVYLLIHILRLITEPAEGQHAHSLNLRKMGIGVKKLEEITLDALAPWFKDVKMNGAKKPLLLDLFRVARQEEKFKAGGVDGTAKVYVIRIPTRKADSQVSESDDGMSCEETRRESAPSMLTHTPPTSHDTRGSHSNVPQGAFFNDIPLRTNQNTMAGSENLLGYPTTMAQSQTRNQSFDGISVSGAFHPGGDPNLAMNYAPPSQVPSRRNSAFPDFSPPSTTNGIYQPQYWPSTSSTAGSPSSFPYTTQPTPADTSLYMQTTLSAQNTHHSAYVHPFDGGTSPATSGFPQQNMSPGGHNPQFAYNADIKVPQ